MLDISDQYRCDNQKLETYNINQFCDGSLDCFDDSDERYCHDGKIALHICDLSTSK